MKNIIVCLFLVSALALPAAASAQSGDKTPKPATKTAKAELKWQRFEAGFSQANEKDKKVLLDVYTDWCGWCKRLDKDVYSDQRVIKYLGEHYSVVKLNAEDSAKITYKEKTSSMRDLAGAFGVHGYPTIIFFDSKGEAITSIPGYVNAEKFLAVAKFIGEDYYKSMTWENFEEKNAAENPKE